MIFSICNSTLNKKQTLVLAPVFLALFLIPVSRAIELPFLLMVVSSIIVIFRYKEMLFKCGLMKVFTLIFGFFLSAALFSVVDSVRFDKSIITALTSIRFYLVGFFLLWFVSSMQTQRKVAVFISSMLLFWTLDAWVQFVFDVDIFGYEYLIDTTRISGVFGESAKLGNSMIPFFGVAVLPFLKNKKLFVFVSAFLCSAVFISLNRAAWLSMVYLFVIGVGIAVYYRFFTFRQLFFCGFGGVLLLFAVFLFSPVMQQRLDSTINFSLTNFQSVDAATAGRLTLWETSIDMIADNYINGVGVRAYRYAYKDYASNDDQFVNVQGVYHPHQILLEFLSETGMIGLVCYLGILGLLVFTLIRAIKKKAVYSIAYGAPLVVVLTPFNTHLATYSSYWSGVVWLCFGLYFAALKMEDVIGRRLES